MKEALVTLHGVTKRFTPQGTPAIAGLTASISAGQVTGLVGTDGAGKTTLMRLMAGLLAPTDGRIEVLGLDSLKDNAALHRRVGYMPQRFGLYEELTVQENLDLHADLRNVTGAERKAQFQRLLEFTGLAPFTRRYAGRLSGGMKQKLGLACALLSSPRLMLLDEPSVGVDPISRRELWRMVYELTARGVGVVWSTSYLDEAEKCAEVIVLNEGQALYQGDPRVMSRDMAGRVFLLSDIAGDRRSVLADVLQRADIEDGVIQGAQLRLVTKAGAAAMDAGSLNAGALATLTATEPRFEDAFVARLGGIPKSRPVFETGASARQTQSDAPESDSETYASGVAVLADSLTKRFGDFTAADHISFSIKRGEIFGLLGPNGAGKSTIFKMLCGLLRATSGKATVDGVDLFRSPSKARSHLGYMAQKFSLYGDLSVLQNLEFFSGVYGLRGARRQAAVQRAIEAFNFAPHLNVNAGDLPLGYKQRLSLACAIMHEPAVLFLDEPTSGVDPITRREFWGYINAMVRGGVTVMVTTHFMDEAEYCDRLALIYGGKTITTGTPDELKASVQRADEGVPTLEEAFIRLIETYDLDQEAA